MGCFNVHHQRKAKNPSASSSSLVSPQSIIIPELEHGSSCPFSASYSGSSRNFELVGSHVSLSKPSPLHSSSFKHLKPPAGASPLRTPPFSHSESIHLVENGAVERSFSYGHGDDKRLVISHSAPKSSLVIENEHVVPNGNEPGISNANLFPLPLPPTVSVVATLPSTACTDDASSESVSSTGSGSSLSALTPFSSCSASARSVNSKSCNNSLSCFLPVAESCPLQRVHPIALPLPPPPDSGAKLLEFSYEELAGACLNFACEFFIREGGAGPVFRAVLKHAPGEEGSIEVAVTRLNGAREHSFKKWKAEVGSLARLSHPYLCKVLGFSGEEPLKPSDKVTGFERERLIVYEHTSNGSLESLLYCRKGKAPLDWVTRVKIAMGAAQGLAYLHERIPRQIIYKSFRTINVQVDLNFNAKLSDYGFAKSCRELPMSSPAHLLPVDNMYMAPETRMFDELSTKSNVWSFGIVLLELLTGRQHMDDFFPPEERNLLQWCRPYLLDSKRLYLIMDPELKGRYPTRVAKMIADLALHCLAEDPVARPSMRDVARNLFTHGADIKADDASNMGAKNHSNGIIHINPASSIGFGYHMNGNSFGKPSYDGSAYNHGSKFKLSKSYNLASILASPARAFGGSARANENTDMHHAHNHKTRLRGFLSEEISKEASRSMAREHPFLSSYGILSEEIGMKDSGLTKTPIYYEPPPLGRSISSSNP